jgi:hypothetical protein
MSVSVFQERDLAINVHDGSLTWRSAAVRPVLISKVMTRPSHSASVVASSWSALDWGTFRKAILKQGQNRRQQKGTYPRDFPSSRSRSSLSRTVAPRLFKYSLRESPVVDQDRFLTTIETEK